MNVGDLIKVRMKWGQPSIVGIIVKMWHDRTEWVYEVRNLKSGRWTHVTGFDVEEVIRASR